uniref:BTB domain-containing protein n=1 Tax=Caenorhabditis tropicalis TaxID=1561998 RepID=A0A1I7T5B5_9PELO
MQTSRPETDSTAQEEEEEAITHVITGEEEESFSEQNIYVDGRDMSNFKQLITFMNNRLSFSANWNM